MENRIKEQFVLFADWVSAVTMRANQLRLYLSVMAYTLMAGLRRLGLRATELATVQVGTIRLRLLKIGAQVRVSVRKVWVQAGQQLSPTKRCSGQSSALCAADRSGPLGHRSLTTRPAFLLLCQSCLFASVPRGSPCCLPRPRSFATRSGSSWEPLRKNPG